VQTEHDAASGPQASWLSTQTPLASHLPPESHAVMPSLHAPLTLVGTPWQVPLAHDPAVQSVFRLVQSLGVPTQTPAVQASLVHASLSVHVAALLSLC
jgi:hypothetical protein